MILPRDERIFVWKLVSPFKTQLPVVISVLNCLTLAKAVEIWPVKFC